MESTKYNENYTKYLREKNIKEADEHERSGKISPTKLTKPTLEACLQLLGVPSDPPSEQGLRYFLRGNTFEELAAKAITFGRKAAKLQAPASYRNGYGLIDVFEKVPHEIKSAGGYTWRRVVKEGKPLAHHALQAAWYALATECDTAWVHYIDTDKLQLRSFQVKAIDYKAEIDSRTDSIIDCLISGNLPDFTPLEDFNKVLTYSDYAMFFNKKGKEAEALLKQYYETQYKLLKSKKLGKEIQG